MGASDDFSRRLSRNIQLIIQEEAQLARLIDPGGGAWHVEQLTDQLARQAWARFQAIEAGGGLLAALQIGRHSSRNRSGRRAAPDMTWQSGDKSVLVGVNAFVNEDEPLPSARKREIGAGSESTSAAIRVTPLKPLRLAQAFEKTQQPAGADA